MELHLVVSLKIVSNGVMHLGTCQQDFICCAAKLLISGVFSMFTAVK